MEEEESEKDLESIIQAAKNKEKSDKQKEDQENVKRFDSVYFEALNLNKSSC